MPMKMITWRCGALLVMLTTVAAVEHNQAGLFEDVPCVGDSSFTYDIILPTGYSPDSQDYPGLFVSSPGGDPNLKRYLSWANERGFIVVALNDSKNGAWEPILKSQDEVLASLKERDVRMHHCLRYAAGASGAGYASVTLLSRYPDQFAGVHISVHSGNGTYAEPHQAVTMYAGLNDNTHPWKAVKGAIDYYEANDYQIQWESHNNGHKGAKPERIVEDIEWMYWRTFFSHPALTAEDREHSSEILSKERDRLVALPDAKLRMTGLHDFLDNPVIVKSPIGKELAISWGAAVAEAAAAETVDLERFWILAQASEQPWFSAIDRDVKKQLTADMKTLARDKAISREYKAYLAYQKVMAMKAKARSSKEKDRAAAGLQQLAQQLGDTVYGAKAATAK